MGTEPIEQEGGERWENYVQRSARFCAETMTKEQPAWNTHPGSAHLPLSLCLTAIPKTSSLRWHGAPARREQRKASLPIALSFDQLQFGHMPFHHAVSDPPAEPGSHRLFVFLDSCSKGLEFWKVAALYLSQPTIEAIPSPIMEHLDELRARLIRILVGFGVAFLGCLIFASPLWRIVKAPGDAAFATSDVERQAPWRWQ